MKIIKSILFAILFPLNLFSQIQGIVIDNITEKPVAYSNIWIENEFIGTTSDFEGGFILDDTLIERNIIVSAIGYETQIFLVNSKSNRIFMTPRSYEIDEVVVKPINQIKQEISTFKENKVEHYYSCGAKPWIAARFFDYNLSYENTPYINQIKIMTISYSDSAIFSLRFLSVNENGEPSVDLLTEYIIVKPEKGKLITTVDLSEYFFKIPENGFFIATEFYVIDKNIYEFETINKETNEKVLRKSYGPMIGNILDEDYKNSWVYVYGTWRKPFKINSNEKKYLNKYWNLAIEVTLTN